MEEDILNYSPIVMFRGTPCIFFELRRRRQFLIPQLNVSLQGMTTKGYRRGILGLDLRKMKIKA